MTPPLRTLAALAGGYFLAAELGHFLSVESFRIATLWPPAGLLLAVLLGRPPRQWPALLAAATAANVVSDWLLHDKTVGVSLMLCAANTLEVTVAAAVIRAVTGVPFRWDTVRGVVALAAACAAVSGPLGATAGAVAVRVAYGTPVAEVWPVWWASSVVGVMVVAPLVLALAAPGERPSRARWAEAAAIATLLGLATHASFSGQFRLPGVVTYPFLLWAVLRFEGRGAAVGVGIMATVAVWHAVAGHGPGSQLGMPAIRAVVFIQVFLALTGVMVGVLAAVLAGKRRAEAALVAANASLETRVAERTAALEAAAAENARLLAELRAEDRRKDEFLATLAHELRNPLAPILNAAEILGMVGGLPDGVAHTRGILARQARQLDRLVGDLLDASRAASGKIRMDRDRVDVRAAVEAAVEASRPHIEKAGHDLRVELPAEPIEVCGDATRLAQVFANLLNNAAKYTPDGGAVGVGVKVEGDGWAVVRVWDTGLGLPAEMLPRVFELFTQVDRHLNRSQGGLGIGLALVKRLVELHGGTVAAASDGPGAGTTVTVRLPPHP